MALLKCSECGKEISDKATACPGCGCPTPFKQDAQPIHASTIKAPIDNKKPAVSIRDYDSTSDRRNMATDLPKASGGNGLGFGCIFKSIGFFYGMISIFFWFHYWNRAFPHVSFSSILAFPFFSIKGFLWPFFFVLLGQY